MIRHATRNLVLAAIVAGGSLSLAGCGTTSRDANVDANDGVVGLSLRLPGVALDAVTYVITGPGGFTLTGSIDLSHATTISTLITLPIGGPYTIAIAGTSLDGLLTCAGSSAPFSVAARQTTSVTVHMTCREPGHTGDVVVTGTLNICPAVDGIAATPQDVLVGNSIALSSTAHDTDGMPSPLAYHWTASSGTVSDVASANPTLTCTSAGPITVTLAVTDGDCTDSLAATVTCTGIADVRINEVESSGGVPGDWCELYNAGSSAADISGWKFKDNDDSHAFYIVPAGTIVPAGGYYVLEEAAFGFGLGSADSTRLYDAAGNPVDSYSWTAHATTTYGRCPNGTGAFTTAATSSKGAANDCGGAIDAGSAIDASGAIDAGGGADAGASGDEDGSGGVEASAADASTSFPWPGTDAVETVDDANFFGTNLSGLNYQPASGGTPSVLWAIQNGPSKLYRLLWNGTTWSADTAANWNTGKLLHYPTGLGAPDSEGLTKAEWSDSAIYVSTERDNNANGVSRLSILRFDSATDGAELTATNDWNVTADLPVVGPNLGLEAITYVPDTALVAGGFFDEALHTTYDPVNYPNHGTGLFFVGLEGNGSIYAYALDHVSNGFARVATLASGQVSIMDLAYDREVGFLWGYCDNTCANKATVFRIDTKTSSPTAGRFQIGRVFDYPSTLPNSNNEGITFAPEAECTAGQKAFFWSDDDQINGHAIRRGAIPCGTFF